MKHGWRLGLKVLGGVFVFCLVVFLVRGDAAETQEAAAANGRQATPVVFTEARELDFVEAVSSDGDIRTRYHALVSPKIGGVIDTILVREGDQVEAGKTILFQIDNEKLRQAVELNAQALVIAESSLDERQANLDNAEAELAQVEKDFARIHRLFQENVVTLSDFEREETRLRQRGALSRLAAVQVTLAEQSVIKAKISLDMAKSELAESIAHAPVSGVVSGRFAEPGEMGSTGKAIIRINDVQQLKAVAFLPGQFFPRITPGSTIAHIQVLDREIGAYPVSYKAPIIDSALRTFEVWVDIPGDGVYAVPGALSAVRVILNQEGGVGVPRGAIQHRDGKSWIFVPNGNSARMIEVKAGMETDGWIQLVDSPVKAGDRIITQGQFLLNDGSLIRERSLAGGDR